MAEQPLVPDNRECRKRRAGQRRHRRAEHAGPAEAGAAGPLPLRHLRPGDGPPATSPSSTWCARACSTASRPTTRNFRPRATSAATISTAFARAMFPNCWGRNAANSPSSSRKWCRVSPTTRRWPKTSKPSGSASGRSASGCRITSRASAAVGPSSSFSLSCCSLGWHSTWSSSRQERFDPYPFILLNLVLSCLAAIQAPIIMMSQKRQEAKDRLRSENDYRVNLKAELEIRHLHEKIDHILTRQWERLAEIQQIQLEMMQDPALRKR